MCAPAGKRLAFISPSVWMKLLDAIDLGNSLLEANCRTGDAHLCSMLQMAVGAGKDVEIADAADSWGKCSLERNTFPRIPRQTPTPLLLPCKAVVSHACDGHLLG